MRLFLAFAGIFFCLPITNAVWGQNTAAESELAPLIRQLKDPDPSNRAAAARKLGQFGPIAKDSIPYLIIATGDSDVDVRRNSETALGTMGGAAVIPLANSLSDANPAIRYGATEALGQIGPNAKGAAPELIEVLRKDDRFARMNSAIALSRIGPRAEGVIPALIQAFKDPESIVRSFAIQGFRDVGPDAVPNLCEALNDQNRLLREGAARALRFIGFRAKDSTPCLVEALQDQDTDVRGEAARAIAAIGKGADAASPALTKALSDPDARVRASAADALAEVGPSARMAIPRLTELLKDDSPWVRSSAATSLGKISISVYDLKDYGSLDVLKKARDAMLRDPTLEEPKAQVQRTIDYLQLLWRERLIKWMREHVYLTSAIFAYALISIICFALLWARPILLLYLNESIPSIEVTLPDFLGKANISLRSALVVGLLAHHNRVLDAWVLRYIESARKTFGAKLTVEQREIHVPLPVILNNEDDPKPRSC